jgi:uncharacterized MAPEG superfamily protein
LEAVTSGTLNALLAGFGWGLGNRDSEPQLPPWALRLKRAHANLLENLPSFLGVVLIAHVLQVHDQATVLAAWGFVAARLAFAVVYTLGLTFLYLRTLLYFASLCAIGVIAWRILATAGFLPA